MKFLIAISSLIFLMALLFLTSFRVQINYLWQGKDDELSIYFSAWRGLIRYHLELPVVILAGKFPRPAFKIRAGLEGKTGRSLAQIKKETPLPSMKKLLLLPGLFYRYRPVVIYLLKRVTIRRFYWRSTIGLADPAQTAVACGILWGLKGFFLSIYGNFAPAWPKPEIKIIPSFQNPVLKTALDLIFEVRAGHIFAAGFFLLWSRFKRSWK